MRLAVDDVVAVLQLRGVVLRGHLVVVGGLEAHALDFGPRDVLHAVGDREAPVRRAVDEVRGRAHVRAQVRALGPVEDLQRVEAPPVAVRADERVDRLVLAELVDARREDDQLPAVRHRHARAVDRLVAEPGGREFGRVEVHDALPDAVFHIVDVLPLRKLHRLGEAIPPLPDEEAVGMDLPARCRVHRQHPEDRAPRDEMLERIVEKAPHGRVVAPHRLLHAAHGADHVRLVDHVAATGSFQSPSVISATTSAGTSPSFTTSVRHPWTIIFP